MKEIAANSKQQEFEKYIALFEMRLKAAMENNDEIGVQGYTLALDTLKAALKELKQGRGN